VHPLDTELDLALPDDVEHLLSERDAAAPSFAEAQGSGLLPSYEACLAFYERLRQGQ